ncbi:MAG: hypothetical protein GY696_18850 [Gammaproteobacteria bacterium]|nr:hypothetical protein [Gammaproteobacteria bacterium]
MSSNAPKVSAAKPRPQPSQPNRIQTNFATKRRDQTGGLIESCTSLKPPPPPATPLTMGRDGSPVIFKTLFALTHPVKW